MPPSAPVARPAALVLPLGPPREPGAPEVQVQRLRPAMGTWVAIEATAATASVAVAAIESAFQAVAEAEFRLHPHREGSDLHRINSGAAQSHAPIHLSTWQLLQLAQVVCELSAGTFDPCLPRRPGRLCDLMLSDPDEESPWALCRVPLELDLGGIAKGYAIDRAIDALHAAGCSSGLVNAGGDLRVYGRCAPVLLRHADGRYVPLTVSDESLAVSDLDARRRPPEHQGYYHRVGSTCAVHRFAAVVAAEAAVADALTKCVLLAEERCVTRTLRALGARRVG
jgi:thiamine biosynthesis lipoprotein